MTKQEQFEKWPRSPLNSVDIKTLKSSMVVIYIATALVLLLLVSLLSGLIIVIFAPSSAGTVILPIVLIAALAYWPAFRLISRPYQRDLRGNQKILFDGVVTSRRKEISRDYDSEDRMGSRSSQYKTDGHILRINNAVDIKCSYTEYSRFPEESLVRGTLLPHSEILLSIQKQ